MNHIGAKTQETPSSAWDQLAQTQNFDHPIRQQPTQTTTAISGIVKPIINQTQQQQSPSLPPPSPNIQSNVQSPPPPPTPQQPQNPTDQNKPPEYGEELHPELVMITFINIFCIRFLLQIF